MTKTRRHPVSRVEYEFCIDAAHPYVDAVPVMVICERCNRKQPNARTTRRSAAFFVGCFACNWPYGRYA